jgi:hypothetical protein
VLANIPWWGWVLLVVAAIIVAPLKMKILKRMMSSKKDEVIEDE